MSVPAKQAETKVTRSDRSFVYFTLVLWDADRGRHVVEQLRVDREERPADPLHPIVAQTLEGKHWGWLGSNLGYNGSGNPSRHTLHRDIRKLLRGRS